MSPLICSYSGEMLRVYVRGATGILLFQTMAPLVPNLWQRDVPRPRDAPCPRTRVPCMLPLVETTPLALVLQRRDTPCLHTDRACVLLLKVVAPTALLALSRGKEIQCREKTFRGVLPGNFPTGGRHRARNRGKGGYTPPRGTVGDHLGPYHGKGGSASHSGTGGGLRAPR